MRRVLQRIYEPAVCRVHLRDLKEARGGRAGNMGENEFMQGIKESGHGGSFRRWQGVLILFFE